MALLNVSENEWQIAEDFFKDPLNKDAVKLSRKSTQTLTYSFLKIEHTLYALDHAPENYLGTGGFSKIKIGQTKAGKCFAVKVSVPGLHSETQHDSLEIMKLLDYFKGRAEHTKTKKSNLIKSDLESTIVSDKRLYTVVEKKEGQDLCDLLIACEKKKKILTPKQRLLIALNSCKALAALHDLNIIHRDVKLDNIMVNQIEEDNFEVSFVDFDNSLLLPNEKSFIITDKGFFSEEYHAPECTKEKKYSFASDVYAMGNAFRYLLGEEIFESQIFESSQMLEILPQARPTLKDVILQLEQKLNQYNNQKTPQITTQFKRRNSTECSENNSLYKKQKNSLLPTEKLDTKNSPPTEKLKAKNLCIIF